VPQYEMLVT